MTLTLSLESSYSIPPELALRLEAYRAHFLRHEFLDEVLKHPPIGRIAQELDEYLKQQAILGYHCTKEPSAGYFETNGLRLTDVSKQQKEFLEKFHCEFSSTEIEIIKNSWEEYYSPTQVAGRSGLVWMVLSRSSVGSAGTDAFFRYFGGECVYKPLLRNAEITEKLEGIGRAVVVEVAIPGHLLKAHYGMSKCVLSIFHKTVRPDAHLYRSDASSRTGVPPSAVLKVTPRSEFDTLL